MLGDTVFDIVLFQSLITVSDKYSSVLEKIKIFWENVRDAEKCQEIPRKGPFQTSAYFDTYHKVTALKKVRLLSFAVIEWSVPLLRLQVLTSYHLHDPLC